MKKKRFSWRSMLVLLIGLAALSIGCQKEEEAASSTAAEISKEAVKDVVEKIRIGMVKPHEGFNVLSNNGALSFMNYNNFVMAQMVEKDENLELSPSIFQTWDISDDNSVLTVTIPADAKWHDGKPLTAEDVQFSLEYSRDVMKKSNLRDLKSVEILGEDKLELTFSGPSAYAFLHNLFTMTTYAIPKHIWEDVENPQNYQGEDNSIGAGPYEFERYDEAAQTSHYEAVENYYKGKINVQSVDIRSFETQEALVMALINDEIDMVYNYSVSVDPSFASMLEKAEDVALGEGPYPGNSFLSFGQSHRACRDLEFRKAASYAINYNVTVQAIGGEFGEIPGRGVIPPGNKGFDPSIEKLEYDPEKAKEILDAAGYTDVNGDGLREYPDGSSLDIIITPYVNESTVSLRTRLSEVVMESLKDVGINASLDEKAISNYDLSFQKCYRTKDYDLYIGGVTQGIAAFNTAAHYFVDAGDGVGGGTFDDPEYAEAFRNLFTLSSDEEYIETVQKIQKIHAEKVPAVALCWQKGLFPYRTDRYEGGIYYPGWGIVNNKLWYNLENK